MINASPQAGKVRIARVILGAAIALLAMAGTRAPVGAEVRLEQWTANLTFRLRTEDAIVASLREIRGSALIRLDPRFRFFIDGSVFQGEGALPELYLRYDAGDHRFKIGRFYLPLGIHDYSELYYVGFIFVPLSKFYPFQGLVTFRSEQGLQWEARAGRWSWEVALVGEDGSQSTLGLERPRAIVGRAQTAVGRLVLGINGYTGDENRVGTEQTAHWYGLDGRFSIPQWVIRSEVFTGSAGGSEIEAYYVDVLFHPTALPSWTFLGRAEAVHGRSLHRRYTLGARVVLSRGLAASANWIDDRVRFPSDAGGVNFQIQWTAQY